MDFVSLFTCSSTSSRTSNEPDFFTQMASASSKLCMSLDKK